MELLLSMGAVIEERDDQDQTPLFNAACGLNEDICQILLEKGANTQSIRDTGPAIDVLNCLQSLGHDVQKPLQTVSQLLRIMKARLEGQLHPAVKRGNVDWVLSLLDCGADIEEIDSAGHTPLTCAAYRLNESICQVLLERGAGAQVVQNTSELEGYIHTAIDRSYNWVVRALIKLGANIEELDLQGRTPLANAAINLQQETFELLLNCGASIDSLFINKRPTLIIRSCIRSAVDQDLDASSWMIRFLLKFGTNVDDQGRTPLDHASTTLLSIQQEIGELLLDGRASIDSSGTQLQNQSTLGLNGCIHKAIDCHHTNTIWVIRLLVKLGVDIEGVDSQGGTPLVHAASKLQREICEFLLESGASTEKHNCALLKGCIHQAIDRDTVEMIKLLVKIGADIEEVDSQGRTPLIHAASNFEHEICEFLLESGAGVGTHNSAVLKGCIHQAIDRGTVKWIKLLVKLGADIEELDSQGRTPLIHAASKVRQEICEFLLESGAGVGTQNSAMLKGCIHQTIGRDYGSVAMIRLLVTLGADIEELDYRGRTPLIHAASKLRREICEFLLESAAGVGTQNSAILEGCIHAAISGSYGSLAMIRLLVKLGADIEELDSQGRTPLIHAASKSEQEICEFLLESGAGRT